MCIILLLEPQKLPVQVGRRENWAKQEDDECNKRGAFPLIQCNHRVHSSRMFIFDPYNDLTHHCSCKYLYCLTTKRKMLLKKSQEGETKQCVNKNGVIPVMVSLLL